MMEGSWMGSSGQYGYNGIEYENFLDLEMNLATYRGLDPALGRWCQVDPYAESFYSISPYNSMGNSPIMYTDPEGGFIHIVIGAAVGGVGNLIYQGFNGNIESFSDGLAAFGIGAGAGALGAATGGASLAAMGTAGSVGAAMGYGAAAGAVGGATAGFVQETGNALYFQNVNLGDALISGFKGALWGGIAGGLVGGIAGGISFKASNVGGGTNPAIGSGGSSVADDAVINASIKTGNPIAELPDGTLLRQLDNGSWVKYNPALTNRGPLLPGGYAIPQSYNYAGKVHVHPHAFKHLQELGKNMSLEYRKLIGEKFQESLHSAIDDVLSRPGSLRYNHPYNSGGNRIIFGQPGKTGSLPVVKHFSSYSK